MMAQNPVMIYRTIALMHDCRLNLCNGRVIELRHGLLHRVFSHMILWCCCCDPELIESLFEKAHYLLEYNLLLLWQ